MRATGGRKMDWESLRSRNAAPSPRRPTGECQMKPMIFAAALLLGGGAMAQTPDTTTTSTDAGMATATTVAPDNSAPERDARGIAVISDAATAPAGWNAPAGTPGVANATAAAPSQGSAGPLPPCTRKVTDHCTQTYERGARPGK